MSNYPNLSEQDLISLGKLAEQQNQRGIKIKNKMLKQTHDKKLAEIFEPIAGKLTKVNESTEKFKEVFKIWASEFENQQGIVPVEVNSDNTENENDDIQSNIRAIPNSSYFSDQLTKTLGALND